MTTSDVVESLVEECHDDHVGLWEIVNAAQDDLNATSAAETRELTLQLVRTLLVERGMLVGHPTPDGRGFSPWPLSAEQAIARIEQEWSILGRDPNIGDIAWFTSRD